MYVLLIVVCPFELFLLGIVLSVLPRYTDSDCPFGIFKLFLVPKGPVAHITFIFKWRTSSALSKHYTEERDDLYIDLKRIETGRNN